MSTHHNKRVKFHQPAVPNRIRHTSYTTASGKTSVRNTFVELNDVSQSYRNPDNDIGNPSPANDDTLFDDLDGVGYSSTGQHKQSDEFLVSAAWMSERDKYLAELIMLEGRHSATANLCVQCRSQDAEYRCLDCFSEILFCTSCLVSNHKYCPFHIVTKWNGSFFERITLKDIGLRIQLGHEAGICCVNPQPAIGDVFTIIHSNGIHVVSLDFCACETAPAIVAQLLRSRLFPATSKSPRVAATFCVLRQFQILSFQSKISAFDFYYALARITNNIVSLPSDQYRPFLQMIRQWRHLKMLKRAGRGHDHSGVAATAEGECAVLCPACPQPGKNLPDGWKDAPERQRWLYSLFVGIDANFKLKRRNVSSESADPSLSGGWSYFVEEPKYKAFLEAHGSQRQERSTCSNYDALAKADSKETRFLDSTGVGTVDCIRHDMKRPGGVGALQKGERYINMDYIFFNSIRGNNDEFKNIVISYDIACQWSRHFWDRMLQFPRECHINSSSVKINFLVPKFHLPAHRPACHVAYSFNFTPCVGRTDGEAPERGWSNSNALSSSTKEMGPGSRRDTLDDHFGDLNWRKVCGLGASLLRKLRGAVPERNEHLNAFQELTDSLHHSAGKWSESIKAWERDNTNPNPYQSKSSTLGLAAVKLALLQQEAQEIQQGTASVLDDTVSHSVLISMGLELEEQQRRLQGDLLLLGPYATVIQLSKFQERRNALQRKIDSWSAIQKIYVPCLVALQRDSDICSQSQPHNTPLWLPSAISGRVQCDSRLYSHEWELRHAQANDALSDLRRNLQLRSHLFKHKDRFTTGQQANTRANATISRVQQYINSCVARYRVARKALLSLSTQLNKGDLWKASLLELRDEDVRNITLGLDGESEGKRSLSWIWRRSGNEMTEDDNLHESLRIEWCKARARALRWTEEVLLLVEEMRRVLEFFQWRARFWKTHAEFLQLDTDIADQTVELLGSHLLLPRRIEGVRSYGLRQAHIQNILYDNFRNLWRGVPTLIISQLGRDASTVTQLDSSMVDELLQAASFIKK